MKRKSKKRQSGKQSTDAADAAGKKRRKRTVNDADPTTATCYPIPGGERKSSKGQQQGLQVRLHHCHYHLHYQNHFMPLLKFP